MATSPNPARSVPLPGATSALRAWLYLVHWSFWRHVRVGYMVWIALALLLAAAIVDAVIATLGWGPDFRLALQHFSLACVSSLLVQFLLPIWSLSFAVSAIGGEREGRTMPWLLTRPLSRPAIYLAKYLAVLPWCLLLNLGGFGLLCLIAGQPGFLAFELYWPSIFLGTIAYSALFHLVGAWFRRPAVVGIVYTFFVETFLGSMPGVMKRASICYYCTCLMDEAGRTQNVQVILDPSSYQPIPGGWALAMLLGITVGLLVLGTVVFSRLEYREET